MPGRSTTDATFILKQTIEQYREGQKDICVIFIDLEKAYDRVPREEIWRTMRERLVTEKYVKLVQDMYTGCRTKVRTVAGESSKFNVEVGLHQGSVLSPYLLVESNYELMTREPQKNCKKAFYDIFLLYHI